MRKFRALIAFVIGIMLALMPVAANAHTVYAHHGKDYAYAGKNHYTLGVKDVECDKNPVSAVVWLSDGSTREYKAGTCNDYVKIYNMPHPIKYLWACESGVCTQAVKVD